MADVVGYTKLGKLGPNYKGEYQPGTTIEALDYVYYQGSTYIALIDNPATTPTDDGVNWRFFARGAADVASETTLGVVKVDGEIGRAHV